MKKALCDNCGKEANESRSRFDYCSECIVHVDEFIAKRDEEHTKTAKQWQKKLESLKKQAKVSIPDGL